jgi:hypothetical protein
MKQFHRTCGDFYLCGYELGADAGATLNAATQVSSMSETFELTVTVKALFAKASATHWTSKSSFDASSSIAFCGYSTPNNAQLQIVLFAPSESLQRALQDASGRFLDKIQSLEAAASAKRKAMRIQDGQTLPLSTCGEVCQSGLVVQLILAPFARLEEFVADAFQSGKVA